MSCSSFGDSPTISQRYVRCLVGLTSLIMFRNRYPFDFGSLTCCELTLHSGGINYASKKETFPDFPTSFFVDDADGFFGYWSHKLEIC